MLSVAFTVLLVALVGQIFVSAQMIPLSCPSDCVYTETSTNYTNTSPDLLLCSCKGGTEISSSCYAQFGWYEKVPTACQFASLATVKFSVQWWWNNYMDCGGSNSPDCQYYNGTWISSPTHQQQVIAPFAQTFYQFVGSAPTATHLWMEGSNRSGFGRLIVTPMYD